MISIRRAHEGDIDVLTSLDPAAGKQIEERRDFIQRAISSSNCYVAYADDQIAGYAVLDYNFFGNAMLQLLCVRPDFRRRGVGAALVRHLETQCRTTKFFTSTNRSNVPMQELLLKLGFQQSGVVYNLDEGDPELIFFKGPQASVTDR